MLSRYSGGMTTAPPVTVEWIRLTIGDDEVILKSSPGVDLWLTVDHVAYEGYLNLPTREPASQYRFSVDLIPSNIEAAVRCESQAREVATRLGLDGPVLRDFALEAALGGEDLPYNRVSVPRLCPVLDDEDLPVPSVRVFTAKAESAGGHAYTMRLVD